MSFYYLIISGLLLKGHFIIYFLIPFLLYDLFIFVRSWQSCLCPSESGERLNFIDDIIHSGEFYYFVDFVL